MSALETLVDEMLLDQIAALRRFGPNMEEGRPRFKAAVFVNYCIFSVRFFVEMMGQYLLR